jgi:hypothetical protein
VTAKQSELVRELRRYESAVCMEAAAEIERQEGEITELQSDLRLCQVAAEELRRLLRELRQEDDR